MSEERQKALEAAGWQVSDAETFVGGVDSTPATPTYDNPLAALRRERKVKPGKAAKLLGISRQRLYVVEHATKPLRCMDRLLAKAAMVWPVVDETAKGGVTK